MRSFYYSATATLDKYPPRTTMYIHGSTSGVSQAAVNCPNRQIIRGIWEIGPRPMAVATAGGANTRAATPAPTSPPQGKRTWRRQSHEGPHEQRDICPLMDEVGLHSPPSSRQGPASGRVTFNRINGIRSRYNGITPITSAVTQGDRVSDLEQFIAQATEVLRNVPDKEWNLKTMSPSHLNFFSEHDGERCPELSAALSQILSAIYV